MGKYAEDLFARTKEEMRQVREELGVLSDEVLEYIEGILIKDACVKVMDNDHNSRIEIDKLTRKIRLLCRPQPGYAETQGRFTLTATRDYDDYLGKVVKYIWECPTLEAFYTKAVNDLSWGW